MLWEYDGEIGNICWCFIQRFRSKLQIGTEAQLPTNNSVAKHVPVHNRALFSD